MRALFTQVSVYLYSRWMQFDLHVSQIHTTDANATQLSSCVASASAVWTQFATSSRRLPTDYVDNLETEHSCLTTWILIDIDNVFNNDVTMSSLVTNLNSSTAQQIVNWVTTADGCVHSADTTQLDFAVGKFVQTRQDCRQLVASVHTPTRFNSTVESCQRRRCVLGISLCAF